MRPAVISCAVSVTSARSSPSSASVRAQVGDAADRAERHADAVVDGGGGGDLRG